MYDHFRLQLFNFYLYQSTYVCVCVCIKTRTNNKNWQNILHNATQRPYIHFKAMTFLRQHFWSNVVWCSTKSSVARYENTITTISSNIITDWKYDPPKKMVIWQNYTDVSLISNFKGENCNWTKTTNFVNMVMKLRDVILSLQDSTFRCKSN